MILNQEIVLYKNLNISFIFVTLLVSNELKFSDCALHKENMLLISTTLLVLKELKSSDSTPQPANMRHISATLLVLK